MALIHLVCNRTKSKMKKEKKFTESDTNIKLNCT